MAPIGRFFAVLGLASGVAAAQPAPLPEPVPSPPPVEPTEDPAPVPLPEPEPAPAIEPAPPDPPPPVEPAPPVSIGSRLRSSLQVHGFASEGAFISTANDYIGYSSRGSVELFQAGINVSAEITDRVTLGMQLFSRDEGLYGSYTPFVDWAVIDFRWRPELSVRAGRVKIPFGLYNETADIDAARLPILLPQSVYPIGNREILLAHTGFALYGTLPLSAAGELDYHLYGGTLAPSGNGAAVSRAVGQVYAVETKYLVGGQAFYRPPVEGLRVGGSVLRASIDFHSDLDPALTELLVGAMLVPPDFNGQITSSFRPVTLKILSAEYAVGDWLFAAEYARWFARVVWSTLLPTSQTRSERFYGMATYRASERFEVGAYYSVFHPDVRDRAGANQDSLMPARPKYYGFQRDAAITLRFNAAENWTIKAEAHFNDGVATLVDGAILDPSLNLDATRYWGLFLVNTTVTF